MTKNVTTNQPAKGRTFKRREHIKEKRVHGRPQVTWFPPKAV